MAAALSKPRLVRTHARGIDRDTHARAPPVPGGGARVDLPAGARDAAEVLVIDDAGASVAVRELTERFGARYEHHPRPLGLNAARNTGVQRSHADLVVFVDDDVRVRAGWLEALLRAARENADVDVFTGPVTACLEGPAPRTCGRERPPITTLELGPRDTDAEYAWGANMAIRRSALERVGPLTSVSSTAATSRSGRIACAHSGRARASCMSLTQRSSTDAAARTRGCGH